MKCPNCNSPMFVADETATAKSQVTFFRCTLCVSEHVSSEPVGNSAWVDSTRVESVSQQMSDFVDAAVADNKRYLMV